MEQQMALFADIEVENVVTGQKRRTPLIPLTDAVMAGLFSEDSEEPIGMIDAITAKCQAYGARLGRLVYVESKMHDSVMDEAIYALIDGIGMVHRLTADEQQELRCATFVAAYKQGFTKPSEPAAETEG